MLASGVIALYVAIYYSGVGPEQEEVSFLRSFALPSPVQQLAFGVEYAVMLVQGQVRGLCFFCFSFAHIYKI